MNHDQYSKPIAELLTAGIDMPLDNGMPNREMRDALEQLTVEKAFAGQKIRNREMAEACISGLWLYHNYLDESHTISQDLPSSTGSFWHGIMHRREGDFGNSKYWFRRVGNHPVFPDLNKEAQRIAKEHNAGGDAAFLTTQSAWDPCAFVDLCEAAVGSGSEIEALCRAIQKREWELLFGYCYGEAV